MSKANEPAGGSIRSLAYEGLLVEDHDWWRVAFAPERDINDIENRLINGCDCSKSGQNGGGPDEINEAM